MKNLTTEDTEGTEWDSLESKLAFHETDCNAAGYWTMYQLARKLESQRDIAEKTAANYNARLSEIREQLIAARKEISRILHVNSSCDITPKIPKERGRK